METHENQTEMMPTRVRLAAVADPVAPSEKERARAAGHVRDAARWASRQLAEGHHADLMLTPRDGQDVRILICPPAKRWDTTGEPDGAGNRLTPVASLFVSCITYGGQMMWNGDIITPDEASEKLTKLDPRAAITQQVGKLLAEFLNRLATFVTVDGVIEA